MSITHKKLKNAKTPTKIVVVIGPTASGKSELAVKLAKKYNGEIISADSRQVYKGLDIGTGKVPGSWQKKSLVVSRQSSNLRQLWAGRPKVDAKVFVYKGVVHHCIDFVPSKRQYSVADFKRDGTKALMEIVGRGKTPIICGGTGQYVDALLIDQALPEVPPNLKLRAKLEEKTTEALFVELKKKDPTRAATIDPHNPRRLIRALEIIAATGKPVPPAPSHSLFGAREMSMTIGTHTLNVEIHYPSPPREELFKRIEKRLKERIKEGMVQEVGKLHQQGISWKRLDDLGLEYRYVSQYLRSMSASPLRIGGVGGSTIAFLNSPQYTQLLSEIKHYAKRQQTWFRKYKPEQN